MKKNNTSRKQSRKRKQNRMQSPITIGMDLGDKSSRYCVLNENGEVELAAAVATTRKALLEKFKGLPKCRIAIEVGTHSPWVSRLLSELGHEVIVANARQVKVISSSNRKTDKVDAEMLARLARADLQLLRSIRQRSEKAQADWMTIRIRAALVEARTAPINSLRGLAKGMGERVPACAADYLGLDQLEALPEKLKETLQPWMEEVEPLTAKIKAWEAKLEQIARKDYPETILFVAVARKLAI
jgi:transposase